MNEEKKEISLEEALAISGMMNATEDALLKIVGSRELNINLEYQVKQKKEFSTSTLFQDWFSNTVLYWPNFWLSKIDQLRAANVDILKQALLRRADVLASHPLKDILDKTKDLWIDDELFCHQFFVLSAKFMKAEDVKNNLEYFKIKTNYIFPQKNLPALHWSNGAFTLLSYIANENVFMELVANGFDPMLEVSAEGATRPDGTVEKIKARAFDEICIPKKESYGTLQSFYSHDGIRDLMSNYAITTLLPEGKLTANDAFILVGATERKSDKLGLLLKKSSKNSLLSLADENGKNVLCELARVGVLEFNSVNGAIQKESFEWRDNDGKGWMSYYLEGRLSDTGKGMTLADIRKKLKEKKSVDSFFTGEELISILKKVGNIDEKTFALPVASVLAYLPPEENAIFLSKLKNEVDPFEFARSWLCASGNASESNKYNLYGATVKDKLSWYVNMFNTKTTDGDFIFKNNSDWASALLVCAWHLPGTFGKVKPTDEERKIQSDYIEMLFENGADLSKGIKEISERGEGFSNLRNRNKAAEEKLSKMYTYVSLDATRHLCNQASHEIQLTIRQLDEKWKLLRLSGVGPSTKSHRAL